MKIGKKLKIGKNFLKNEKIVHLQLLIIETTLMALIFYRGFFELLTNLNTIIDVRLQKNSSCYIGLMFFFTKIIFEKKNIFEKMKN